MATYVVLFNWTEQGVKMFKESPARVDRAREAWSDLDVQVRDIYWTLGPHDLVAVFEAPNDEALTAAMLRLSAQGNVRTTTLRAFSRSEAEAIIARA